MQPLLSRIIRLVDQLGWLYIAAMSLWVALRLLFFDKFWWLALVNSFAIALFVPLTALLPWSLLRRQSRLLVGLCAPLGAFFWLFGAALRPPLPRGDTAAPDLTVMSFNVRVNSRDYDRLAAAIAADQPDIVALQELRSVHMDELRSRLGAEYPYHVLHRSDGYHTVGLLSRFPIEAVTNLSEPPLNRALVLQLRPNGRPLQVIVTHLTSPGLFGPGRSRHPRNIAARYARRDEEVSALLRLVHAADQPVLILCDCNFTPTSQAYARLNAELNDSFAAAGWGFGNTYRDPWLKLRVARPDYIWYSDELRALTAFVGADGGSDHLPVVAHLAWR
jgi:vancomycin resistance protein VanJ